jgi:hypothetical protein
MHPCPTPLPDELLHLYAIKIKIKYKKVNR